MQSGANPLQLLVLALCEEPKASLCVRLFRKLLAVVTKGGVALTVLGLLELLPCGLNALLIGIMLIPCL